MRRRHLLLGAAGLAPSLGRTQDAPFPARPVTLLVGFSPGGGADILARLLAPRLTEALGVTVAVENRTGASGTLAMVAAARARPDGHSMTLGTVSNTVVAPLLLRPPPFDPERELAPIGLAASVPMVVTVPAASPARDLAGFIALLRERPGRLNFASNGPGTSQHLAAELFQQATGTRMVHVPYRGSGQAMADLVVGTVDVNFDTLSSVLPYIRQGALRGLAVTTPTRSDFLPDLPTVAEAGVPGYGMDVWYMLLGPAGLPEAAAARWAAALQGALANPELRTRVREAGFGLGDGAPASAASLLRREVAAYADLIRRAGISLD